MCETLALWYINLCVIHICSYLSTEFILHSLFPYPQILSPVHVFTPLSTYFILLSTNLISLSTYFTPLSTDFILLSTSPPSYLRLDPCLECLDEIAKVSASWLILNSKRNTQNISSSASLCLSRLLVYMCRVREKCTD